MHLLVANYLGHKPSANPTGGQPIEEAAQYGVPVATVTESEFNTVLALHGIPP